MRKHPFLFIHKTRCETLERLRIFYLPRIIHRIFKRGRYNDNVKAPRNCFVKNPVEHKNPKRIEKLRIYTPRFGVALNILLYDKHTIEKDLFYFVNNIFRVRRILSPYFGFINNFAIYIPPDTDKPFWFLPFQPYL